MILLKRWQRHGFSKSKRFLLKISIDIIKNIAYTIIRIIKHFGVFVRAALRRRSIFLKYNEQGSYGRRMKKNCWDFMTV